MPANRPAISEATKRIVRQRCGFGCVICGHPLYEYDHLFGYSQTGHDPDKMTLLCRDHHGQKTSGMLPLETVLAANNDPINLAKGTSAPVPLHFRGGGFQINIASCGFRYEKVILPYRMNALRVDGGTVIGFRFESGSLLIDMHLRDADNHPILDVHRSELTYVSALWDVTWVGRTLELRTDSHETALRMTFDPPTSISIERLNAWANGLNIKADSRRLQVVRGSSFEGLVWEFAGTALSFGESAHVDQYTFMNLGDAAAPRCLGGWGSTEYQPLTAFAAAPARPKSDCRGGRMLPLMPASGR